MKRGLPFKSVLIPHYDLILELRSKGESWAAIVRQLKTLGVSIQKQSLWSFMKRKHRSMRGSLLRPIEPQPVAPSLPESIKPNTILIPLKPYIPTVPSSKPTTTNNNPGFTRDPALPK